MVLGHQTGSGGDHPVEGRDPMQVAVYPLAVPDLLNPAGIVVLVTLSAEASSIAVLAVGVGVLVAVLAFDVAVFRWAVQVSSKLDASRMLVTEKVFGFLLAALGVNGAQRIVRRRCDPPDYRSLSARPVPSASGLLIRRSMEHVRTVRRNPYPRVSVLPDVRHRRHSPASSGQSVRKLRETLLPRRPGPGRGRQLRVGAPMVFKSVRGSRSGGALPASSALGDGLPTKIIPRISRESCVRSGGRRRNSQPMAAAVAVSRLRPMGLGRTIVCHSGGDAPSPAG